MREKKLRRMLNESASRTSTVNVLNLDDLEPPNEQAKITANVIMTKTLRPVRRHLIPGLSAVRQATTMLANPRHRG